MMVILWTGLGVGAFVLSFFLVAWLESPYYRNDDEKGRRR